MRRLVGTIAEIKEAMLEDAGSDELRFNFTGGLEIQNKSANFDRRTWIDLNFEETDTENDD